MKTYIKSLFLVLGLIAGLGLMPASRVMAQTYQTLHSFSNNSAAGINASEPYAGLVLSSNTLYGTTFQGGAGSGAVFKFNTNGAGFTILHNFTDPVDPGDESAPYYTNSGGAYPLAELVLSGNTLFGTARSGGSSGIGTVFKVSTDGTGFTILHSFGTTTYNPLNFSYGDGAEPLAGLILSDDTLYGTASSGGTWFQGTVFSLTTNGTGFKILHTLPAVSGPLSTNSDGVDPQSRLILSGNTLYGTASLGGSSGNGTIFAINTDGTGFTVLHNFTGTTEDGARPDGGLVLSGNTLYGTAFGGGNSGNGKVFALTTNGTDFTVLHSFPATSGPLSTNSDGANPHAGLILSGNTLYGTARNGGGSGNGTVFGVKTDGTGFTVLHSFTATSCFTCPNGDGARPLAGLILSGNTLYGTAWLGGSAGYGTAFSLSLPRPPPQLTIIRSGANVILTWPTNFASFDYTGFTLQSTTNLASTPVWSTNSPEPTVVNGQNTVTNPASGTRKFFRLKSQ